MSAGGGGRVLRKRKNKEKSGEDVQSVRWFNLFGILLFESPRLRTYKRPKTEGTII